MVSLIFHPVVLNVFFFLFSLVAHAGLNKAASTSTSLNTRKLDEETENLTRK